ncbi:MAG: cysteine hydrolase [Lachnospiraceae bacterium]|nr:cysteine hydrolase [Lachnospiraceae bacterium]
MTEKVLIVVDMQKDFVDGVLGTKEAQAIVPAVVEKIKSFDGTVIYTRDTHQSDYMETQEGKKLPVPHCMEGSEGWELIEPLDKLQKQAGAVIYDKPTFGSVALADDLKKEYDKGVIKEVELIGVCTDICVVSNALLIKANMPELTVKLDASCCAGVTVEKHEAALETMRSCQVEVQ